MIIKQFKNKLEIRDFKNPLKVEIIKFSKDLKENKLLLHDIELIKIFNDNSIVLKDKWNIRVEYQLNEDRDLIFEDFNKLKIVNW